MPIPQPNGGESQSDFMSRCVPFVESEGKPNDQAVAICLRQFRGEKMLLKSERFKADIDEERTFHGYAASYGNIDSDGDIIERGAFAKSIKEGFPAGRIKVLWQHDSRTPIGMPIDMYEDARGLYVRAKISKTRAGDEAIELMRDGVVDRMSVGFSIPNGKTSIDDTGVRRIHEGRLMEFSVVTFPANEQAVIQGVKSLRDVANYVQTEEMSAKAREELLAELANITALLKGEEPPKGTPAGGQPPELDSLKGLIDDLGDFARKYL